jgi:transposase
MRFVAVRSLENQATLMRHKTREMLVSQRTQLLNGLRGHLTEIGVIAAQGPRHARDLAELIEICDETIPFEVCEALAPLVVQLRNLDEAIARLDRIIAKLAQKDETARRLMSIPGFGPITASAMAATIQDTSSFAGPRELRRLRLGRGHCDRGRACPTAGAQPRKVEGASGVSPPTPRARRS